MSADLLVGQVHPFRTCFSFPPGRIALPVLSAFFHTCAGPNRVAFSHFAAHLIMVDLQLVSKPAEDDWHGVTDPKIRKKIQDKLAQRARRGYPSTLLVCHMNRLGTFFGVILLCLFGHFFSCYVFLCER
jgi:hypothetical protein